MQSAKKSDEKLAAFVSAVEVVWEKGALTGTASRVASPECAAGAFSVMLLT